MGLNEIEFSECYLQRWNTPMNLVLIIAVYLFENVS